MSLLLCRQENVKHPYHVKELGIYLYSSQELSYVVYNHPLLTMDGFVGERLLTFLRDELNQGFLALKLERWMASKEDPDEMLVMILQECDYYSSSEITKFRQQLAALRKKHPAELGKMRADELFALKQYGKAEKQYKELLDYPEDSYVDESFLGRIWNNLGSCYGRMLHPEKALEAYEKAYTCTPQLQILKHMYFLSKLNKDIKLAERFRVLMTDQGTDGWDEELEKAKDQANQNPQLMRLTELFMKDSIKRQAGEAKLLGQWKREYRGMA